ncbi:MAG: P-loop NTPase [Thermodesulfobacteriota bacterium]
MKIVLCGKGGSGKSSVAAVLARALAKTGLTVLVVDGDESNTGLHRLLGLDRPVNLMDHLGGKKAFKQKMNQSFPATGDPLLGGALSIGSLPPECVSRDGRIHLIAVGKIHDAGEGCACPMGLLSKTVLSKLGTAPDEVVLIDTEAGIEHFGRGVDGGCQLILGVIDPTFESFELAQKIGDMARAVGAEFGFILNKTDSRSEAVMAEQVDGSRVVARLPFSDGLFVSGLKGQPLNSDMPEIAPVCDLIKNRLGRSGSC